MPPLQRRCLQHHRLLGGGRKEPESSSYSDESQEAGQGVRLRSRTPPDRRVPAEPSAPPKAKGTAVKSKAKIVLPQEEEGRSESSSSSPEPARGSRPEAEGQASEARPEALRGQGEDPPQDDEARMSRRSLKTPATSL